MAMRISHTQETTTTARSPRRGFPLPFRRGEGQGEGTIVCAEGAHLHQSPLTPALSPSAGEREKQRAPVGHSAFTLVELLVVLSVLAFLTFTLLPALARTKGDSRTFQCLNHTRELNRAWRMWSDDNQDLLLYAGELPSDPATTARTWVTGTLDFSSSLAGNWDPQVNIMKSPLWPYCGTNVNLWRCPTDESVVVVNGVAKPRVRSYKMNIYLGGWGGTDGGWGWANQYRIHLKSSEILDPPPASLFVFTELRSDAFGDGNFYTRMDGYSPRNPAQYVFTDFPAYYHDGTANFSYADGRAEIHRWLDRRTTPPMRTLSPNGSSVASPRNPDISWLQDRATRPQ